MAARRKAKDLDAIQEGIAQAKVAEDEAKLTSNRKPRRKKSFVEMSDVVANTDQEVRVQPITAPDTPLASVTIFDGIEDADDALTYRIPEEDFYLKGNGMFEDNPDAPLLATWKPREEDIYFTEKDGMIVASYLTRLFDVPEDRQTLQYIIAKKHYKERIPDLLLHINYFISHYDAEKEYLASLLSVKRCCDTNPDMKQKAFRNLVLDRIITPTLVSKVKHMAMDLYRLNINTDKDGKYKTTPKITNDHARMIVAISFCLRLILPICIHFSNTNSTFVNKRDYIDCFDRIFMGVVDRFEKNDTQVWNPICRFVAYRVERSYTSDLIIWEKKKQLYGITVDLYLEQLIHEVILVKSLHKLAYNRSIVSFIDGIITHSYTHYRYENFKYKPVEVETDDSDSDEYMSHQETLEMAISRVDESNQLINETNAEQTMREIRARFNIEVTPEEYDFYSKHTKMNKLSYHLIHTFFSKYFHDGNAIRLLDNQDIVWLQIYLKKYLELRGMPLLAQFVTAGVHGKYKDTCIKNAKFLDGLTSSSVYQAILDKKYRYVRELHLKEDPIIQNLSVMINSQFNMVDMDEDVNGQAFDNLDNDQIKSDYMNFLSVA